MNAPGRGLRTVSVRGRVALAVLAVLTAVLVLLSVAVSFVFAVQTDRNLDTVLRGRVQLARQLARAGSGGQQIVNRVGAEGVVARLELADGTVVGSTLPTGQQIRSVQARLNAPGRVAGAVLTLAVDASFVRDGQRSLRWLLVVASLAAVALSALLVTLVVRLALRPLDQVAGLARSITQGRRGERLRPQRGDTEIGQTAQALDDMLDELEGAEARARRAEERSRTFLADAAHELRTPVTGIRAAAETLLHSGADLTDAERQQLEVLLIREAGRAGALVSDLLAAARLDAGLEVRPQAVGLLTVVATEVERARLRDPGAALRARGAEVVAWADPERVAGILTNLLDNAVRAAGPGGWVEVATGVAGNFAVVEVVDSGPGVSPADRERIFERMVRLDADRRPASSGGSGLGLAIARGWARAQGGELVCLEPVPGQGGRFRLTLPLGIG